MHDHESERFGHREAVQNALQGVPWNRVASKHFGHFSWWEWACSAAFEKVPIEVNRAGNENRTADKGVRELETLLHCNPNARRIAHHTGFARDAIRFRRENELVTGRTPHDKGLQVVTNYKHALKRCRGWVDAN